MSTIFQNWIPHTEGFGYSGEANTLTYSGRWRAPYTTDTLLKARNLIDPKLRFAAAAAATSGTPSPAYDYKTQIEHSLIPQLTSQRMSIKPVSGFAQVNDLKAKFTADTGSKTGPGALGAMQQPVSTAMKASSHAFSSLLSGVFGQKPDKQLAVLERIAQNTSPKDTGVQSVTSKTTLASDRGGFKTAFGV